MINNIVKQVLSAKQAQFEELMSNPRSFVQQSASGTSSFSQQLTNEQTSTASTVAASTDQVAAVDNISNSAADKEWQRRFSANSNTQINSSNSSNEYDKWNIATNYTVQSIQSKYATKYIDIIEEMSEKYNVPVSLIQKMIETESNYNPNATSSAGAKGLMQLMPANLKEHGVTDATNPRQNIEAGVQEISGYLSKYNGDLVLALAAYNAGPGNVKKYGGVPPFKETENYIKKILNVDV